MIQYIRTPKPVSAYQWRNNKAMLFSTWLEGQCRDDAMDGRTKLFEQIAFADGGLVLNGVTVPDGDFVVYEDGRLVAYAPDVFRTTFEPYQLPVEK